MTTSHAYNSEWYNNIYKFYHKYTSELIKIRNYIIIK